MCQLLKTIFNCGHSYFSWESCNASMPLDFTPSEQYPLGEGHAPLYGQASYKVRSPNHCCSKECCALEMHKYAEDKRKFDEQHGIPPERDTTDKTVAKELKALNIRSADRAGSTDRKRRTTRAVERHVEHCLAELADGMGLTNFARYEGGRPRVHYSESFAIPTDINRRDEFQEVARIYIENEAGRERAYEEREGLQRVPPIPHQPIPPQEPPWQHGQAGSSAQAAMQQAQYEQARALYDQQLQIYLIDYQRWQEWMINQFINHHVEQHHRRERRTQEIQAVQRDWERQNGHHPVLNRHRNPAAPPLSQDVDESILESRPHGIHQTRLRSSADQVDDEIERAHSEESILTPHVQQQQVIHSLEDLRAIDRRLTNLAYNLLARAPVWARDINRSERNRLYHARLAGIPPMQAQLEQLSRQIADQRRRHDPREYNDQEFARLIARIERVRRALEEELRVLQMWLQSMSPNSQYDVVTNTRPPSGDPGGGESEHSGRGSGRPGEGSKGKERAR